MTLRFINPVEGSNDCMWQLVWSDSPGHVVDGPVWGSLAESQDNVRTFLMNMADMFGCVVPAGSCKMVLSRYVLAEIDALIDDAEVVG